MMALLVDVWPAIRLTLSLAFCATVLLLMLGTPLAWWLARSESKWVTPIAAVVALPLVLPPTVLGFYLLVALGPNGPGGWLAQSWGGRTLAFSFPGLLIGSVFYSLPFVVQPLRLAFEAIETEIIESAYTEGATFWQMFRTIALPLARPGYVTGGILGFAHTVGEFGVVLMIGGNIPGQTKVLSIAIYDYVEQLRWTEAHWIAGGMVIFAFVTIATTFAVDRRMRI